MRLSDKVAIISGGASGMGAATARIFAAEGAKVVLTDLNEEDGEAVAAEIREGGSEAMFVSHDVSSEEQWSDVVEKAMAAHGKIDVLVNNAGVSGSDPDQLSIAIWDQQMSINAKGVFLGMRSVLPIMKEARSGSIINISSISGIVGQDFVHMGYNAAKGAVRTATKAAAVQYAEYGVRVNSVHPGIMPPMRTSKMSADPQIRTRVIESIPMRREGRIEEVAYANLFLASDESSYITGAEIPVDGGFVAV
jgi:NAD(P)-dependent dehydrogenase (short-subunit alcohol dehydrogenase family)